MATGISSVVLAGNLTRDPELNPSGKVLNFGVAVNRYEKDSDGNAGEAVHFFDVKVLGNRAQALSGLLKQGAKVTVLGDLVQERWEKDGQKRSAVRVLAREVVLGGSRHESESSSDDADSGTGW